MLLGFVGGEHGLGDLLVEILVAAGRGGGQHDGPVMEGIAPASHIRRLLRTGQTEEAIALLPEEAAAVLRRELTAGRAPVDM